MIQFITRYLDRIYDRLHQTETARAWEGDRCVAMLRLPKGYCDAIGELASLLDENSTDDVQFVPEYED